MFKLLSLLQHLKFLTASVFTRTVGYRRRNLRFYPQFNISFQLWLSISNKTVSSMRNFPITKPVWEIHTHVHECRFNYNEKLFTCPTCCPMYYYQAFRGGKNQTIGINSATKRHFLVPSRRFLSSSVGAMARLWRFASFISCTRRSTCCFFSVIAASSAATYNTHKYVH